MDCLLSTSIIKSRKGTVVGYQGIIRDITKRKKNQNIENTGALIYKAIETCKDLKTLYFKIHRTIQNVIKAKNFYIALYDKTSGIISFPYVKDEIEEGIKFSPIKLKKSSLAYIIKKNRPLLGNEKIHTELEKKAKVELVGKSSKSWITVPLLSGKKVIGAISVQDYKNENAYNKEDLNTLTKLSIPIANAIERKRIQMQQSTAYKISELVNQSPNLEHLYKSIHKQLSYVTDVKNFYIAFYDEKENMITFPYFIDENRPGKSKVKSRKFSKGLTEYTIKTGKAFFASSESLKIKIS